MGGGGAAGGDFDAMLASKNNAGWRGLFKNGKVVAITVFASLGEFQVIGRWDYR